MLVFRARIELREMVEREPKFELSLLLNVLGFLSRAICEAIGLEL
jgi:hypothetical protein